MRTYLLTGALLITTMSGFAANEEQIKQIDAKIEQLEKELHHYRIEELNDQTESITAGRYDWDEYIQEAGDSEKDIKEIDRRVKEIHDLKAQREALQK